MRKQLPLFPTSLIGSMPRSKALLSALRMMRRGMVESSDFNQLIEAETLKVVKLQEDLGIDIITSGELGRDNYVSFVSDKIGGVQMMSMSEMLDYIDDKKAFEDMLTALDVPAVSIKNAICVGKLQYNGGIVADELLNLKKFTDKPVKITLPGPYLLTRSMWLPNLSGKVYGSKEELGQDVIRILKEEIDNLVSIGVDVIQFDEPVLTEVVFTEGKPRSFMCAALSERKDPKEELEFAGSLIGQIMEHIDRTKTVASLHVCRGNWSKNESTLLTGPYTPLLELLAKVNPDLLTLEFSTPRAGELNSLLADPRIVEHTALGLGVINPRTDEIETVDPIVSRVEEAMTYLPMERLWLNPDCGFATFSNSPVNVLETISGKIRSLTEAASILRSKYHEAGK
ncbi:cobalamin-independent methionine synthase II family protein [Paenibacillus mucilaginosus]|uniref:5-methyltetrahydropteroyltriglutamate-homocysteine methyltransferase n=1 Tax=Paenibacillus mucilaginosus (strain KNP414) TaxID=1036673 RepID=F8FJL6_PAEMK|nr:cobalamin-independent methionine synthase II family protein [Paenibacillus mucilaginosus]AEI42866.1 5-methyltetrahydropteroyltriglutamate- homocysteine methyltransferase [Paenibacillus mucilaginosus KNP414]MCG7216495.1 cobalamin-independent methionine synthase II family protein [Paenibacillus mucilaginosus]WDM31034.1 cobalamin-independent methionine synthase II family protein [Paenibacillus mucilaginosus]